MSINSFTCIWVTKGGDLSRPTATGAAQPAAALACVCRMHAVAVRPAALVSDEKRIRGVYAKCLYKLTSLPFIIL